MTNKLSLLVLDQGPLKVSNAETIHYCGEPVSVDGDAYLCRCGESSNKPFCDGSHKKAGFTGENLTEGSPELKVWEGDVVAGLTLRVAEAAPLGDINLDFVIDYQACNDEVCFAPAKTQVRVPVRIVPAGTPVREVESPLLERAPFPDGP